MDGVLPLILVVFLVEFFVMRFWLVLWMDRSLPSILVFLLWKFLSCAKFGLL